MIVRAGLAALLAPFVLVCSAQASDADNPARSGFEWWRLRPTDVSTTGSTDAVAREGQSAKDTPTGATGERRAVRVVYPGLIPGR